MAVQRFNAEIQTFIAKTFRRDVYSNYIPYSIANEENLTFVKFLAEIIRENLLKIGYNPKLEIEGYYDDIEWNFRVNIPIDDLSRIESFHANIEKTSNKIFFFVRKIKDKKIKDIDNISLGELIKFYKAFDEQKILKNKIKKLSETDIHIKKRL